MYFYNLTLKKKVVAYAASDIQTPSPLTKTGSWSHLNQQHESPSERYLLTTEVQTGTRSCYRFRTVALFVCPTGGITRDRWPEWLVCLPPYYFSSSYPSAFGSCVHIKVELFVQNTGIHNGILRSSWTRNSGALSKWPQCCAVNLRNTIDKIHVNGHRKKHETRSAEACREGNWDSIGRSRITAHWQLPNFSRTIDWKLVLKTYFGARIFSEGIEWPRV